MFSREARPLTTLLKTDATIAFQKPIAFLTRHALLLTLALVTFILLIRRLDAFIYPQFWCEDGVIFFKQSLLYGAHALFIPYADYLHLIIRIIAYIASFFPYTAIPAIYNYAAYFILIFVCSQLFSRRLNLSYKPLFALAVVLTPNFGEVYMRLTNIQWLTAILPLLVFLKLPPTTTWQRISDILIILLTGLTGPFMILLAPLFVFKYVKNKSKHNLILLLLVALTVFIQGYYLTHPVESIINPTPQHHIFWNPRWLKLAGIHFIGTMFLGSYSFIISNQNSCLLGLASLLLIILVYLLSEFQKDRLVLINTFIYFMCVLSLSTVYKLGSPFAYYGDRYDFLPHLMLTWSLIACLTTTSKFLKNVTLVLLFISTLFSITMFYPFLPYTNNNWKYYAVQLENGKGISVPTHLPGFFIDITPAEARQINANSK